MKMVKQYLLEVLNDRGGWAYAGRYETAGAAMYELRNSDRLRSYAEHRLTEYEVPVIAWFAHAPNGVEPVSLKGRSEIYHGMPAPWAVYSYNGAALLQALAEIDGVLMLISTRVQAIGAILRTDTVGYPVTAAWVESEIGAPLEWLREHPQRVFSSFRC